MDNLGSPPQPRIPVTRMINFFGSDKKQPKPWWVGSDNPRSNKQSFPTHRIHGTGIFTYTFALKFYGKLVGKYAVRPMNLMGNTTNPFPFPFSTPILRTQSQWSHDFALEILDVLHSTKTCESKTSFGYHLDMYICLKCTIYIVLCIFYCMYYVYCINHI